jgi:hypothetical protein
MTTCKLCGFTGSGHFHTPAPIIDADFIAKYPCNPKPAFVDGSCAHEWENTGLVCGSEYIFSCIFCSETATIGMWR